jgi:hypothetical protein
MRGSKPFIRPVWTDQFNQPTPKSLREGLSLSARRVYDAARQCLVELDQVREQPVWYGECWHWCLEYRVRHSKDPLAVIIPCPADLQLALPMPRELIHGLHVQQLTRTIRDGLELAQAVFDSRWGVWSLTGKDVIDDLQDLIEMKLNHLAKRVG